MKSTDPHVIIYTPTSLLQVLKHTLVVIQPLHLTVNLEDVIVY